MTRNDSTPRHPKKRGKIKIIRNPSERDSVTGDTGLPTKVVQLFKVNLVALKVAIKILQVDSDFTVTTHTSVVLHAVARAFPGEGVTTYHIGNHCGVTLRKERGLRCTLACLFSV